MNANSFNKNLLTARDTRFDTLRVIGLLCIILAHTNPPPILFQLRNFDVPLMVIVSGAVFGIASLRNELNYLEYFKKRVLRLLNPTWVFLSFYFIIIYIFSLLIGFNYPYSVKTILSSYTLISGIGYVWIIRVFILVAAIAPLILKLHNKIKEDILYFGMLLLLYITYEITYLYYNNINIHVIDFLIQNIVFYIIPYGCLFGLGLRLPTLSKKSIQVIVIINFVLFCVFLLKYSPDTQLYKYPPRLYYLSYSVFVSLLLYLLLSVKPLKILSNNMILFISSPSMWIYLWHIWFIFVWEYSVKFRPTWANSFLLMFLFLFGLASITTYIQINLVKKCKPYHFLKVFL